MSQWKKIGDVDNGLGQIVHEVECPYCKHRETYIYSEPPISCYCCGKDMRDFFEKLEDRADLYDNFWSLNVDDD